MGQTNTLEMVMRFDCDEPKALEKLVKFLQKQVYVLDTQAVPVEVTLPVTSTVMFVVNHNPQRRAANVHSA